MAKTKARKQARAKAAAARSPRNSERRGASRPLGEGENFGKGQVRRGRERVRGAQMTRPGMRGPAADLARHEVTGIDVGGEPSEPPLQSSTRPDDLGYERDWDET